MDIAAHASTDAYLEASAMIDFDHDAVRAAVAERPRAGRTDVALAEALYRFVRDEIPHSWDIRAQVVTASASEVALHGHGICYAKSHLLAALLRANGIPAGICYQRLVLFDDPADGYALHALNAVYLDGRWVRIDARGNKPGVDAQFSLDEERLAFPVRTEMGERDYPEIYAEPHPIIVRTLRENKDALDMYVERLPSSLDG